MFGKLDARDIEELLNHELVGRVGCHVDGITYIVPVSYAYDGTYIYGYTQEGMKINMMRKNPKLCFEVDDMRDLSNWKSVIVWGDFEELVNEKDKVEALKILHKRVLPVISSETMKISPLWPFSTDKLEQLEGIVYRINIIEKTGRFEKSAESFFYAT